MTDQINFIHESFVSFLILTTKNRNSIDIEIQLKCFTILQPGYSSSLWFSF